jgi:hypothetical protein
VANGEAPSKLTAPYGPWKTFKSYLGKLKSTKIPPVIDATVMTGLSGSAKSELRTALRFLNLTTDENRVTPQLRDLVSAYGTDKWQEVLGEQLATAYLNITENVELESGTLGQLSDAFKARGGVDGSVVFKAVRFYLAATEDAGETSSPHFKARRSSGRPAAKGKGKSRTNAGGGAEKPQRQFPERPANTNEFPFAIPGKASAMLYLPDNINVAEWEMIDSYIRAYIGLGKAG